MWLMSMPLRVKSKDLVDVQLVDEYLDFRWFFGETSRVEAETYLLDKSVRPGTFLVRKSEHDPNGYSLSIRDDDSHRGAHVKHYKIKFNNGTFSVVKDVNFNTLQSLIQNYRGE